jgi:hypothetical protein
MQENQSKDIEKVICRSFITEPMRTISVQIDALVLKIKDPTQQIHTYNIKKLLQMKQRNLDELSAIKKPYSSKYI